MNSILIEYTIFQLSSRLVLVLCKWGDFNLLMLERFAHLSHASWLNHVFYRLFSFMDKRSARNVIRITFWRVILHLIKTVVILTFWRLLSIQNTLWIRIIIIIKGFLRSLTALLFCVLVDNFIIRLGLNLVAKLRTGELTSLHIGSRAYPIV